MTPELEVLDQLQGGKRLLFVIRQLFENETHFLQAIHSMLID
jgi:hypothetical protein